MERLSVVIMTFNEAPRIERCIRSVQSLADEILVVDSYSTDRTVALAESIGAKVIQNHFEGFIEQRRFCVQHATHDLILALDCDECPDETLQSEIQTLKKNTTHGAYWLNRLSSIGGTWIRHGAWHPDWKLRLFFREKVIISGTPPHDQIAPQEGVATKKLKGKLLHYSHDTTADLMATVEKYSTTAAQSLFEEGKKTNPFRIFFKPPFRFISDFILKFGFLDSRMGYFIAKANSHYVWLRETKLKALWLNKKRSKK